MTNVQLKRKVGTGWEKINPLTKGECVTLQNGNTVEEELSALDSDCFSPTITQISTTSKVGVGENDVDISANVQEGYVKSAILSGNTLVNMCDDGVADASDIRRFTHNYTSNGGTFEQVSDGIKATTTQDNTWLIVGYDIRSQQKKMMTIGKKYYGVADVTIHKLSNSDSCKVIFRAMYGLRESKSLTDGRGLVQSVFTHGSDDVNLGWLAVGTNGQKAVVGDSFTVHSMSVYEITDEEANLSYEELANKYPVKCVGMTSCKIPVLTTTGKNLLDINTLGLTFDGSFYYTSKYYTEAKEVVLNLAPNTSYTISIDNSTYIALSVNGVNKPFVNNMTTFTTLSDGVTKIKLGATGYANVGTGTLSWIQLEQGTTATPYEPYKTNILTVNEPIELRGIGEVKDELNLMTGEVTERIGEIVLDGSENWIRWGSGFLLQGYLSNPMFVSGATNDIRTSYVKCDRFPSTIYSGVYGGTSYGVGINGGNVGISVNGISTLEAFKTNLSENPIKICYPVANKSIKTVDLTPGGTNPTTKPYVWDGGHIQLSSEEGSLTPSLEYSVTTSRGGQIIQNTQSIAKQDKRVYDLEMLLINASIDEAYKRLTLQNEVMVSYNEELKVNPIRYYMLSRLIEEEMYQESDMLDKLDAFFLYGEINTEQYYGLSEAIVGDNAIATLDEVIASHEIQVDIPTTLEEEVLPSDRPTTLEEQPIVEEVEGTPVVELKDCSKTYTLLMNKLELSIQRVEDLAHYVGLANAYICANRLSYEEYELVIARIENAHISLH